MPTTTDFRLPAFARGMRIGLFGGTFDPPHRGHVEVSLVALAALRLHQVWWLVSPQNPLKPDAPSDDLARRIAAARRIVRHPRVKITGIEATLGTRYTVDTLRRLLPRLPGVACVWMMGADNFAGFHRWHGWQTIAASLPFAVFNRPTEALAAMASPAARALSAWRIDPHDAAGIARMAPPAWVFLPSPHVRLSSTALRSDDRRRQPTS